jgi:hypothetical protein
LCRVEEEEVGKGEEEKEKDRAAMNALGVFRDCFIIGKKEIMVGWADQ